MPKASRQLCPFRGPRDPAKKPWFFTHHFLEPTKLDLRGTTYFLHDPQPNPPTCY